MADLAYSTIPAAGAQLSSVQVACDVAGDTFPLATEKVFAVTNGDAAPHTVTIAAPVATTQCGNYGELAVTDRVITVAAGETMMFTIPTGYGAGGLFSLAYDAVTSMSIAGFSTAIL